jgi:hypothetical protein
MVAEFSGVSRAREQGFLVEVSGLAIIAEESSMNNGRRGKV